MPAKIRIKSKIQGSTKNISPDLKLVKNEIEQDLIVLAMSDFF